MVESRTRKLLITVTLILFSLSALVFPAFTFMNQNIPAILFSLDLIGLEIFIPVDNPSQSTSNIISLLFEGYRYSIYATILFGLLSLKYRKIVILSSAFSFLSGSLIFLFHLMLIRFLETGQYGIIYGSINPNLVVSKLKLSFSPYIMILCGFLFLAAYLKEKKQS